MGSVTGCWDKVAQDERYTSSVRPRLRRAYASSLWCRWLAAKRFFSSLCRRCFGSLLRAGSAALNLFLCNSQLEVDCVLLLQKSHLHGDRTTGRNRLV
jgi:hypothetical protein